MVMIIVMITVRQMILHDEWSLMVAIDGYGDADVDENDDLKYDA